MAGLETLSDEVRVDLVTRSPCRSRDFFLEIDVVKEGRLWFSEEGSPTLKIPLSVE